MGAVPAASMVRPGTWYRAWHPTAPYTSAANQITGEREPNFYGVICHLRFRGIIIAAGVIFNLQSSFGGKTTQKTLDCTSRIKHLMDRVVSA